MNRDHPNPPLTPKQKEDLRQAKHAAAERMRKARNAAPGPVPFDLNQLCEGCVRMAFPPDIPANQRRDLRHMFMAGATVMFNQMMAASGLPQHEAERFMRSLSEQLEDVENEVLLDSVERSKLLNESQQAPPAPHPETDRDPADHPARPAAGTDQPRADARAD